MTFAPSNELHLTTALALPLRPSRRVSTFNQLERFKIVYRRCLERRSRCKTIYKMLDRTAVGCRIILFEIDALRDGALVDHLQCRVHESDCAAFPKNFQPVKLRGRVTFCHEIPIEDDPRAGRR